ncbi:MAG: hypothetical protein C0616_08375 [Desulfuromonas sp.]|nr:MAG: hypothetical protein C0616_08375 [Desulfuromonas sp.]
MKVIFSTKSIDGHGSHLTEVNLSDSLGRITCSCDEYRLGGRCPHGDKLAEGDATVLFDTRQTELLKAVLDFKGTGGLI